MTWDGLVALGRDRLAADPDEITARMAAIRPGDPLALLYTSGTTGNPKGVVLTHQNILYEMAPTSGWPGCSRSSGGTCCPWSGPPRPRNSPPPSNSSAASCTPNTPTSSTPSTQDEPRRRRDDTAPSGHRRVRGKGPGSDCGRSHPGQLAAVPGGIRALCAERSVQDIEATSSSISRPDS